MEKDNKWGMFRNFMYNELGISKEDIRQWIKEAVHDEATKMLTHSFGRFDIETITKEILNNELKKGYGYGSFKHDLAESLAKKMIITLADEK